MNKTLQLLFSASALIGLFAFALALPALATTPQWDTTGDYIVNFEYLGTDYPHDVTLMQDGSGQLTGNGGSPAGANTYLWSIQSGAVTGDSISLTADYTATSDAVNPLTTLVIEGTIAPDGSMSGTWSDNYANGDRSGTWATASGLAEKAQAGNLAAEDFGVVSYDTGTGILSGYTAGFGLTDATLAGAKSIVVELFAGNTLLQTNTANIAAFNADITGTQFSSPFDVSGTFAYATDGYWINERASEYGQTVAATKVVATVTLSNGKVVTTKNTILFGNPDTIFPIDQSPTVTVTISKFVQGSMATAATANNADFPMTATWEADNLGDGTGSYALSETSATPYQVVTAEMTKGANYETKELVNGNVVGAQCATGKPFALVGYTTGNTHAAAMAATPSMAKPSFTNLQQDKFVIVWNRNCALPEGQIGGDVIGTDVALEVTSIEMIDTTATANSSFSDGWEYVFHITAPMHEDYLSMKFSDWIQTGGAGTLPVANNMRISSLQADNGGATILLTGADVYANPALRMVGDLDPTMPGRQVQITVEVAVPNGTPNGSYTTNYGVRSDS